RFQWNFPIFFSPHDPKVLYCASQFLCRSTNEGQTWQVVSPDLTRNDKSRQEPSGGPITKDNTGVEIYCTVFAAAESPLEKGVLWCGSDDGLVHVSRDDGKTWSNVTPKGMPEWMQVNSIEIHPTHKGGLYLAGTRYRLDDFKPYLYKTLDYGNTWTEITAGIDPKHCTRVVRADPLRPGLLYAGTERGVYVSFDDGTRWQPMQLDLPVVPVTDLAVKNGDLVAATQGRAFWILDDLDHLRQLDPTIAKAPSHLFTPERTVRIAASPRSGGPGKNPPAGVVIRFHLDRKIVEAKTEVELEVRDKDDTLVRRYSSKAKDKKDKLELVAGMNKVEWDRRYPGARKIDGMILWGAYLDGPNALPGKYKVNLIAGDKKHETQFVIERDPRSTATPEDLDAQFAFLTEARDKLTETHDAIARIRALRTQIDATLRRVDQSPDARPLTTMGKELRKQYTAIEELLYQTKNKSAQDPLNFPIRLNNKLGIVAANAARGDNRPTDQAIEVKKLLTAAIDRELARLRDLDENELKAFNDLAARLQVPQVK
ncbi:MAG: glycosyl hydrolase, partial [Planctomycetes bacterium]|nr:glycosyl hydrolase [Planctomycetota bacterium]